MSHRCTISRTHVLSILERRELCGAAASAFRAYVWGSCAKFKESEAVRNQVGLLEARARHSVTRPALSTSHEAADCFRGGLVQSGDGDSSLTPRCRVEQKGSEKSSQGGDLGGRRLVRDGRCHAAAVPAWCAWGPLKCTSVACLRPHGGMAGTRINLTFRVRSLDLHRCRCLLRCVDLERRRAGWVGADVKLRRQP